MIDILNFIDDLKEIKTSLGPITDNKTMKLIDDKIGKYDKVMSDFEESEVPKHIESMVKSVSAWLFIKSIVE